MARIINGLNGKKIQTVKLFDINAYTDDEGHSYLNLTYLVETDDGVYHVVYPAVDLGIDPTTLPTMECDKIDDLFGTCIKPSELWSITFRGNNTFFLRKGDVSGVNAWGDMVGAKDVYYATMLKKPKVNEMTIEEIEKKLGYKVKIVGNKEIKD